MEGGWYFGSCLDGERWFAELDGCLGFGLLVVMAKLMVVAVAD